MAGYKAVRIAKTVHSHPREEQIPPPETARTTVSVASLFQQKHELRRKAEAETRDVLAPKSAGVFKQYAATRQSRGYEHPLFCKFQGATQDYRDASGYSTAKQLEPVYNELVTQVDELAVSDSGLLPTDTASGDGDNESPETAHARLTSSLGDDKIRIRITKADGTSVEEERKLSETMKTFERVLAQKREQLEELLHELKSVDSEIATVKQDIVAVEQKEVKQLKRSLDTQIAALLKLAEAGRESLLADAEKAYKDDKKATNLQQQRFEEFMDSL